LFSCAGILGLVRAAVKNLNLPQPSKRFILFSQKKRVSYDVPKGAEKEHVTVVRNASLGFFIFHRNSDRFRGISVTSQEHEIDVNVRQLKN